MTDTEGSAEYVFGVTFRLAPADADVSPDQFETTMAIPAEPPESEGWRFFRDWLWHGEVTDESRFRRVANERLGFASASSLEVLTVDFRELRTDPAYLETLREAIAGDLESYNAENVDEALHKYLGSSIHVRG